MTISAREVVHRLNAIRRDVEEQTPLWYMLNRFTREAMTAADEEEARKGPVVNARINTRRTNR